MSGGIRNRFAGYCPGFGGSVVVMLLVIACGFSLTGIALAAGLSGARARDLGGTFCVIVFLPLWCLVTRRSWTELHFPNNSRGAFPLRRIALPVTVLMLSSGIWEQVFLPDISLLNRSVPGAPLPDPLPPGMLSRIAGDVFLTSVLMPMSEELLFRGIILHGLLTHHRALTAIALSSLLFAAMHFDLGRVPSLFLSGCLYGWLYHATRSVSASWLAHGLNNFWVFVLWYLLVGRELPSPAVLVAIAFLALLISVWAIRIILARLREPHWRQVS